MRTQPRGRRRFGRGSVLALVWLARYHRTVCLSRFPYRQTWDRYRGQ